MCGVVCVSVALSRRFLPLPFPVFFNTTCDAQPICNTHAEEQYTIPGSSFFAHDLTSLKHRLFLLAPPSLPPLPPPPSRSGVGVCHEGVQARHQQRRVRLVEMDEARVLVEELADAAEVGEEREDGEERG